MKLSRTMVLSYASMVLGALVAFGVVDVASKAALLENIDVLIGSGMAVYGIVMAALRKVTSSPLLGWLNKSDTPPRA